MYDHYYSDVWVVMVTDMMEAMKLVASCMITIIQVILLHLKFQFRKPIHKYLRAKSHGPLYAISYMFVLFSIRWINNAQYIFQLCYKLVNKIWIMGCSYDFFLVSVNFIIRINN
jgi:hypothetical protein